jgi:hypothetical protein
MVGHFSDTDVVLEFLASEQLAPLADLGTSSHGRPVLLHGEDGGAWPVLRLAGRLGLATRIGAEDTLFLPNGERAASNAELVRAGLAATRPAF